MSKAETGLIRRVMVVVAMEEEAAPMIGGMGLTKMEPMEGLPTVIHSGSLKEDGFVAVVCPGRDKSLGVNMIGTDAAALTTFVAARDLKPDLIVNAGTCGGFKRTGGEIGDVFCVTSFRHHDRRIPIPGYDDFGRARRDAASTPRLVESLGLKSGICSTGNSLDFIPQDDERMQDAVAKDMEGAAVAWAAELAGDIPVIGIKVVTDIVDGDKPTHEEFLQNLKTASDSLQDHVPKVLDFVVNKQVSEL